jgi:hypothetical protein
VVEGRGVVEKEAEEALGLLALLDARHEQKNLKSPIRSYVLNILGH